ncbi:MAG TPA: DegQ family serine endoprotease [Magnetospirillaceae bacterium]|jgi:serine protease Do
MVSPSAAPSLLSASRRFAARVLSLAAAGAALVWVTALSQPALAAGGPGPDGFADLAARLLPAVVNVSTTQTLKKEDVPDLPQFPPGSPFDEFFKDFMERQKGQDATPRKVTALGSGFIIDPSGLIVTNNHVIDDADQITVILHDEQAFKAKLIGRDTKADLALLKIEAPQKLPFVPFGDSDGMRVGDWVLAIGNPFGLGGTVTAGIVSARARDINAGPYDDFIQTDASINKGNSGGPLFNMKGEVIGINTAIFSPSGGSIGIGFSIPSNEAKPVLADLQKFGKTRRGWLGVRIQSVTPDIADSLGLKEQKGALIAGVTPNGPAEKAGIKTGDVILTFDGKSVEDMRHLPRIVAETNIDKEVDVQVWRDGKMVTVKARVGELPDDEQANDEKGADKKDKKDNKAIGAQSEISAFGFTVAAISQQLRERYDLPADAKGVVVTDVKANGAAADKGLRPGDLVLEAMQEAIKSPQDLVDKVNAAKKSGHKSVLLLVQNEGGLHFVPLRFGGPDSDSER